MWWRKKEGFVKEYLDLFRSTKQSRYTILDTEMSSLDIKSNHMLSCGVIDVEDGNIITSSAKEWFVHQPEEAYNETATIHAIHTPQPNSIEEREFVKQFLAHIGSNTLVAHSASLDVGVINKQLKRVAGIKLKNKVLDTQQLAIFSDHGAYPGHIKSEEYSLDTLCQKYGIEISKRHTALGDAYATAQLFISLRKGDFV